MSTWERATFDSDLTVERRRSSKAVGFALAVAALVGVRASPLPAAIAVFAAAFASILVAALHANPWPRLVQVHTYASAYGLFIGKRAIARPRIESAVLVPGEGEGRPYVRVVAHDALPIELGVPSVDEGRALLRALGLDAARHASEFRATSTCGVLITSFCIVPLVALPLVFQQITAIAIAAVVGVAIMSLLFPTTVSVGADGVSIRRFSGTRFIASSAIEWVQTCGFRAAEQSRGAVLQLKTGEQVRVPIGAKGIGQLDGSKEITAFIERVEEAIEAHHASACEAPLLVLDRAGRSIKDWMHALRSVGSHSNVTHRTPPTSSERLLRVVESPAARPVDRAAAAVAVQSSDDDEAKVRVRVAARAVAHDKLRVALEAAADEDDARTAAALDDLASDHVTSTR